ncbi:MAG: hypothetical protein JNL11_08165 [Bdellovibrionaceae bacterium]|nr:hypothetical protein [Pseudobdellovibrionaceae bacterium]
MKWCLVFFILIISQLGMGYVEFPKNCVTIGDRDCYFGTIKQNSEYNQEGMKVFLGTKTLLKHQRTMLEWIHGAVLFEVGSKTDVLFKKSVITMQKGQYLFFGDEGKLQVDVLAGNLQLGRYQVTEGFSATFNALPTENIELEPLRAIDLKEHLVRYIRTKNLNRDQAQSYIDEFSLKHKNYVEWVSELNQDLVKRSIAQDESDRRKVREIQERARRNQEKRKQEYFKKVFER